MFKYNVKYLSEKSLKKLKPYDFKAILKTLQFLLDHEWSSIFLYKVKSYHLVPLYSVKTSISNHCKESELIETEDNSSGSIISFAYKAEGRLLGFRKGDIFFVTYIDVNHDYC